jgi:hypothetical protein
MNEENLAIKIFVVFAAEHSGIPEKVALRWADRWLMGVRDHSIGDVCAVHMPNCYRAAEKLISGETI